LPAVLASPKAEVQTFELAVPDSHPALGQVSVPAEVAEGVSAGLGFGEAAAESNTAQKGRVGKYFGWMRHLVP
jgi:hypothetical protein